MESGFNGINSTFVLSCAGERLVGVSSSAVQNMKRSFHADYFCYRFTDREFNYEIYVIKRGHFLTSKRFFSLEHKHEQHVQLLITKQSINLCIPLEFCQFILLWTHLASLQKKSGHSLQAKNTRCSVNHRVFHKLDEIGNNVNIGIRFFTTWKQKSLVTKCYPNWE